jgi:hypothetical protein
MIILFSILALGLGMTMGKIIVGLDCEWFARIGTIVIGLVSIPFMMHPLSIAYLIGFIIQSICRLWVMRMVKEARG